jgi:hypothetical protein
LLTKKNYLNNKGFNVANKYDYDMESLYGEPTSSTNSSATKKYSYDMESLYGSKSDENKALESKVKVNISEAVKQDPLAVFKSKTLSQSLGLPQDVTFRNLKEVEANAKSQEWEAAIAKSPTLKKLTADPYFAGVSFKDDTLPQVEKLFREDGFAAASRLRRSSQDNAISAGIEQRKTMMKTFAEEQKASGQFLNDVSQIGRAAAYWTAGSVMRAPVELGAMFAGNVANVPSSALSLVPAGSALLQIIKPFMPLAETKLLEVSAESRKAEERAIGPLPESVIGNAAFQATKSVSQNLLPMIAGIVTGNPEIGLAGMSAEVAGSEYVRGREEGMSPVKATTFAGLQSATEYVTEKISFVNLLGNLKIGKDFAATFLSNQVRRWRLINVRSKGN